MTLVHPATIHWARDAANTMRPAVQLYGRAVGAENYLTRRQKKVWLARSWRLGSNTGGTTGTVNLFRFRRRSSIGVTRLQAIVTIGRVSPPASPITTYLPYVEIDVTAAGGGGTTAIGPFYYGNYESGGPTPTDAPSEWHIAIDEIAIASATTYECVVKAVDHARVLSVAVRELGEPTISQSTDYYNAFVAQAGAPLYDATRERLLKGLSEMYRWNAGGGWDWAKDDGSAQTRTSATYANLYDGSTTGTPTAATRGFHIDNEFRVSSSKTTVPYEIAVYGNMSSAATGNVKLMDTAGNSYGPVAITATSAQWTAGTVNLPNDARKYDLQFAGDGSVQLNVYAVSITEWDDL